jgi:hypothetical protein
MNESRWFHVIVHALPEDLAPREIVQLDGRAFRVLDVSPQQQSTLFPLDFDEAYAALGRLPQMFIEPDGAFVWVSAPHTWPSWQVDGIISEREAQLSSAELKGRCPRPELSRLLQAMGWPQTRLMYQVVQHAVFLDEQEFHRWLEADRQT